MFKEARNAYGVCNEDDNDLIDHLNPHSSYELDIGVESLEL